MSPESICESIFSPTDWLKSDLLETCDNYMLNVHLLPTDWLKSDLLETNYVSVVIICNLFIAYRLAQIGLIGNHRWYCRHLGDAWNWPTDWLKSDLLETRTEHSQGLLPLVSAYRLAQIGLIGNQV